MFFPFIHSFHSSIHPFIHSSLHSFIPSFIHSSLHSSLHPFIHSFLHSFIPSFIHSFWIIQVLSFIHNAFEKKNHSFILDYHSFIHPSILDHLFHLLLQKFDALIVRQMSLLSHQLLSAFPRNDLMANHRTRVRMQTKQDQLAVADEWGRGSK